MTSYRIYVLQEGGHITAPLHIVLCDEDEQAIRHAREHYLNGRPVEVWDEARCVVRLTPTD